MPSQDFHIRLQVPPLTPTTFCQPVGIGGPRGTGPEPAAWPILVPAKDAFQVCYTLDKTFRDTYLERGFCGLDASFRDQFDHKCPEQMIHVAPTVREGQQQGTNVCQDDDHLQERSIFGSGWYRCMNMLCHLRNSFERFSNRIESVWAVLFYFTFVTIPTAGVTLLAVLLVCGLILRLLELLGLLSLSPDEDTAIKPADPAPKSSASEKTPAAPAARTKHAATSTDIQPPSAEPIATPAPTSDDDSYELLKHELETAADHITRTPSTTTTTTTTTIRRARRGTRGPRDLWLGRPHAYEDGRDWERIADGYVDVGRATPSSQDSLDSIHTTRL